MKSGVVVALAAASALALSACSDDIDTQVGNTEEIINERSSDAQVAGFSEAECERFGSLDDGEKTTCTAVAELPGGGTRAATFTATVSDCREQSGDTGGRTCENTHTEWVLADPPAEPAP